MKITDIDGNPIEVTDLALAIMQADDFRHVTALTADSITWVEKRRIYWQDIYEKLIKLAESNTNDNV